MKLVTWKKVLVTLTVLLLGTLSLPSMAQTTKWLTNNMPHYHEFNPAENPNHYGWCGHTALKIAMQYKTGQVKTLPQIHSIFSANSPGGYAQNTYCGGSGFSYCSKLQDLIWAARLPQNGGYGRTAISTNATSFSTSVNFFTQVKAAINANQPVIIPSNWKYPNVGHFWVVVGYTDWGSPTGSALYLRDVALSGPAQPNADQNADVQVFYNATPVKQMLIIK